MHDIGDEDKYGARCLLAKIALQKFDRHWDPATLGPRWTRSLTPFELFEDGKGLIIAEATVKCNLTRQRRRAMVLNLENSDVQEIFFNFADT